jgi:hypothetical protein
VNGGLNEMEGETKCEMEDETKDKINKKFYYNIVL